MFALPTHISRYEIKGLIGRGGMGDLYLARDTNPNTNRLVAVKLLNATLDSGDLRERFARESRALAALNHPNIVNIYDSGEFEDSPFIVMEYVRGETLAEKIKRRAKMSIAQKLKLMEELCAGLAHAHDAGIIHRDIKPANLMVDQSGRLKILDFGIARVAEGSFTRAGLQMTQVNVRIGTPGYMSPEQIEGSEIDHRSDLFAVGAVCYELLSYHEAFSGANTRQVENKVLQAQPAPLAPLVEGLDPELVEIINRALEKDPAKRYQDAAPLEAAFERQRLRLGPSQTPAPLGRPTPVPSQNQGGRPRGPRAEAAYQRALAVYDEGAHEAARRLALETLAEDPDHEGARALHDRLQPNRRWTPPPPRPAKPAMTALPTVVKTRAASSDEDSSSDLTIRVPSAKKKIAKTDETTVRPRSGRTLPSPSTDDRALWTRHRRALLGAGIAVAAMAVLIGVFRLSGVFGPAGQLLTITKPTGGTVTGKGIKCGTLGSDCSTTPASGDPVELDAKADAGFVFTGYTGDCAPAGRTLMIASRTCGATFARVEVTPPPMVQLLTITTPKGGTLLSAGIECGTLGSDCSENVPDGLPVTLRALADSGYTFLRFTGDCAPSGESLMTKPRACGATFVPSSVAVNAPQPAKLPSTTRPPAPKPVPTAPPPDLPAPPPPPPPADPPPGTTVSSPPTLGPGSYPAPPPISAVDQAKKDIQSVLKNYCAAYEALNPVAIRHVYPAVAGIDNLLRQYKAVECTFSSPPEFVQMNAEAGTATVEVGVKQIFDRKVGGVQKQETTAVMKLSRPEPRGSWRIDSMLHRAKR